MGFFKKIFNKILGKKDTEQISQEISQKNEENRILKLEDNSINKFNEGLRKSSSALTDAINELAVKYIDIDERWYEHLEEVLISYDVGYVATNKIIESIRNEMIYQKVNDPDLIKSIIIDKIFIYYIQDTEINTAINLKENQTNVVLVVGVNGVGKTTSIAKITKKFIDENKKVLLVAGDTFRAGAVEQLKVWAQRLGVDIELPNKEGQDPASVIYAGVKKGYEQKYDLVICDTSGRLQNKINLMNELKKIHDVIHKFDEYAPHETLLVLDATQGQSGINQAKAFNEVTKISGIILTKMDSTSRGGIVLAIKDAFNIPVKLIGLGEKLEDLSVFDLEMYVDSIVLGMKLDVK
ncbi:signal recognition particle-docking protein FtsY [Ureaplasma parvum]|uniref:Signal recognition particle receptor FtsY n=3 Tax=Ureaplasma parvum TaxID=134821 RepID=Q9PR03_UREPA|nr:signal recognition particle-docking protein FtsY [Ureaplasma parvum]pir/D82930/ SRP family of GTP-binding proteins, cell division protein UU141 [imported] - Ureaplasma urealyticum [Ureaplasma urealyticum]AAF30547.1 SRP family of GTP-binding proteins - cell division protein [Ureaplasma parvum serovar 3 str. ATCC 700970]ACA33172.1 signal recognition particle-docking protein FtsY [Ureaplasma parvum serovar 3 str. ATCC 27815]ASD24508.1 signal recognition particle-docking protein FtsY [Ureaplasma